MEAYSRDPREQVFAGFESGMKRSANREKSRMTSRFVLKLVKRHRGTGSITSPKGRAAKWLRQIEGIQQLVESHPLSTLEEFAKLFDQELGLKLSVASVWRVFRMLNITLKKVLHAANQERLDVKRRPSWWKCEVINERVARFVFIDEAAANTKMRRLDDRGVRGQGVIGRVPHGPRKKQHF